MAILGVQRQMDPCELEDSLVYKSFKTAKAKTHLSLHTQGQEATHRTF